MSNYRQFVANPVKSLAGDVQVASDKSISHRAIMFGSLAKGTTCVKGFLSGEDSLNTLRAFVNMGVDIKMHGKDELTISGVGMHGLTAPSKVLYMGNSGTSMRLLAGLLAAQKFASSLSGDSSLSKRPMQRVIVPLAQMGAKVTAEDNLPPLIIEPATELQAIQYLLPMPSAQVKSCVLLAAMYAKGKTTVIEPAITRDHTERMLQAFGYHVAKNDRQISIVGGGELSAQDISVPGDISSAAFFIVAATIATNATLRINNVGINPTRTGVLDILKLMGAKIEVCNQRHSGQEPVADLKIQHAKLCGINIPEHLVPLAIDEFPVIFIAAAVAKGTTVLTGAKELKVKESDRILTMVEGLNNLGVDAVATADGVIIKGGSIGSGTVKSYDDHRIAMSFAVAAVAAKGAITIENCQNVATSFPNFVELANQLGMHIEQS